MSSSTEADESAAALATLGRIGAPHGIKGWVKLISFTDPVENILDYREFILGESNLPGGRGQTARQDTLKGGYECIEIDECRSQGKDIIAHISGCDDRDQARQFTGRTLQVERAALPDLSGTGYYWFQLEGLQVVNLQQERLGSVHHLMETGANDVLVVRPVVDSIDDQERLIPWLEDQVIKAVDLDNRTIEVDWEKDY